jgi:hypothetical protein
MKTWPRLIGALFGLLLVGACTKVVEEGEFHFLRIGMSKAEVIEAASAASVRHIRPEPDTVTVITNGNPKQLSELLDREGMVISDNRGFSVQLGFDRDSVTSVNLSVPAARTEPDAFFVGQPKSQAFETIRRLFGQKERLQAWNFLPDGTWVDVVSLDSDGLALLRKYDNWSFNGKEYYSTYRLKFEDDGLIRIVYSWSYVELP